MFSVWSRRSIELSGGRLNKENTVTFGLFFPVLRVIPSIRACLARSLWSFVWKCAEGLGDFCESFFHRGFECVWLQTCSCVLDHRWKHLILDERLFKVMWTHLGHKSISLITERWGSIMSRSQFGDTVVLACFWGDLMVFSSCSSAVTFLCADMENSGTRLWMRKHAGADLGWWMWFFQRDSFNTNALHFYFKYRVSGDLMRRNLLCMFLIVAEYQKWRLFQFRHWYLHLCICQKVTYIAL